MKLQPLVSWWLLAPYILASCAFVGWQFWKFRGKLKKQPVLLRRWIRRSALLILPGIIALGISVQGGVSSLGVSNLDVFFVVDTTPSMGAVDYVAADSSEGAVQRMEGVKQDLRALAPLLQGAHLQIITFDSEPNVTLPLTNDMTAFVAAVDNLTPQISAFSQGSTIDKPINLVTQQLKNAQDVAPERFRLVYYLGDGEQTTEKAANSFEDIAQYIAGGAVLGYGTTEGAQILNYTGLESYGAELSYITTYNSADGALMPAISKMSPEALQTIANQLNVDYLDRNQGGPAEVMYQSSKAELAVDRSQRVVHYLNLYWLFAIPLAGLLFWEWQKLVIKLLEMRKSKLGKPGKPTPGKQAPDKGKHA